MNYYEILGVSTTTTLDEIKVAYRNLIKAFHPDYYKGNKEFAQQKTVEVNRAYEVLKDNEKRLEYDSRNNFWKGRQEYDYSEELNEAKRRAEESEKARKAAEAKVDEEKKKREEMEFTSKKQQEQMQSKLKEQTDNNEKSGKFIIFLLNFASVLVGIVVYLLVDLIFAMVIALLSQVPIICGIVNHILYYNSGGSDFGYFSLKAIFSTLAACYVSNRIIDFSKPKHYWGTCIMLATIIPANYNLLMNGAEDFSSFMITLAIHLYAIYLAFTKTKLGGGK